MNKIGDQEESWEVIVVGGGCAGLSAAIYLGRAMRKVLVIDSSKSLALWEPDVQNYFGFPKGVSGKKLLSLGKTQAEKYESEFVNDEITNAVHKRKLFILHGKKRNYQAKRVLLATGLLHLPPDIPQVKECLGHSIFFCKDCDGYRNQEKQIVIVGKNNDAVEYALGMICYASCVSIATNGQKPSWDKQHEEWISEYKIPVYRKRITNLEQEKGFVKSITFADQQAVVVDAIFSTRGDVVHNKLGKALGAKLDENGQIMVDRCMKTSVPGLYAAGCVTPANCQMIIAAGNGATAAQAINRDLFEESLRNHRLRCFRAKQMQTQQTAPKVFKER